MRTKGVRMALSGVKMQINISEVIDAIKRCDGVMSIVAPALGMCTSNLYVLLEQYPELKIVRDEARKVHMERRLDIAEKVLQKHIESEERADVSARCAMYFLNNQGRKRGYAHPDVAASESAHSAQEVLRAIQQNSKAPEAPPKSE